MTTVNDQLFQLGGMPVFPDGIPVVSGKTFWVDSGAGVSGAGTFNAPYLTLAEAKAKCVADRGDLVVIKEGHAETFSSAAALAWNVAGCSIVGLGSGSSRPTFTFGTATGASFDITANNTKLLNVIGLAAIDGLTKPFNVTGNGCELDIEWQDASASVEAATCLRLDTADNAKVKLKYNGFTAGNAVTSAVILDDCDNVDINIHAYGVCSTAWVDMQDVASTNVKVSGYMYTSGVTNSSRLVVDTITGSTWFVDALDGSAGAKVSGGSAAAVAADDVSSVASSLATLQAEFSGAAGIASFPASAAPANNVSLAEVVRDIWDVLRNGTGGAEPATNRSITDYVGASATFFSPNLGFRVATATPTDIFDGTTDKALFTVSGGKVMLKAIWVEVSGAAIDNTTSNLTFSTNPTVGTDAALTTNLDIDSDEVGSIYSISAVGSATSGGSGGGAAALAGGVIIDVGTICIDTSADAGTGGALGSAVMYYIPLESGATVAAAF